MQIWQRRERQARISLISCINFIVRFSVFPTINACVFRYTYNIIFYVVFENDLISCSFPFFFHLLLSLPQEAFSNRQEISLKISPGRRGFHPQYTGNKSFFSLQWFYSVLLVCIIFRLLCLFKMMLDNLISRNLYSLT